MAMKEQFSEYKQRYKQSSVQGGEGTLPYPVLTNEMLKFVKELQDKRTRMQEQLFLAEGEKLVAEALASQVAMEAIIIAHNASERAVEIAHKCSRQGYDVYQTGSEKFHRISTAQTPQGILAVVQMPEHNLTLWQAPCILALDGVNDPGNVGTIIRTAEWFGVRDILLSANSADVFNPKTVRATMGSVFRCRVHSVENLAQAIATHSKEYDCRVLGAELRGTTFLRDVQWTSEQQMMIVVGNESHGLSGDVRKQITESVVIEGLQGSYSAESLNVSMSVGILLHQRFIHTYKNA